MRTLVLQHIACEPPGVFEDVLHERGAELHRVELDQGEPLPDWPEFDAIVASSPAYANQAFRFGRAYGVQFHLEVSPELARDWADVPEYVSSLERTLGSEGGPAFLDSIEEQADEMRATGRDLFERWLDRVAAPAGSHS